MGIKTGKKVFWTLGGAIIATAMAVMFVAPPWADSGMDHLILSLDVTQYATHSSPRPQARPLVDPIIESKEPDTPQPVDEEVVAPMIDRTVKKIKPRQNRTPHRGSGVMDRSFRVGRKVHEPKAPKIPDSSILKSGNDKKPVQSIKPSIGLLPERRPAVGFIEDEKK